MQKTADVRLVSYVPGREWLPAVIESFGATLRGHRKVIILRKEAFRMSFSKGKQGWTPVIN